MIVGINPVMRSSDMEPKTKDLFMKTVNDVFPNWEASTLDFMSSAKKLKTCLDNAFSLGKSSDNVDDCWHVVVGKQFAASADVKRKWFAHVYLCEGISILAWRSK